MCSLAALPSVAERVRPGRLVSLGRAVEQPPTPPGLASERHLRLEIDDVSAPLPGARAPEVGHVERLLAFLRDWEREEAERGVRDVLLLHCFAGISRSTAAALIALALGAEGREAEAAARLRAAAPHAQPNRRLVEIADDSLKREGRLVAAREAMGTGELRLEGPLVRLPARI